MRLAEHESEGDNEQLITEIVVDVRDPAAPIFEAARLGEGIARHRPRDHVLQRGRLIAIIGQESARKRQWLRDRLRSPA